MRDYGSQSMIGPLRKVLVRRPDGAFGAADPALWHYAAQPNLTVAQQEHDALVDILRSSGAEVFYHDERQPGRADAVYVHDPAIITDRGAIILRMGKELRRGEEEAMARRLEELGVPLHYRLGGGALAEGGDLLWVDSDILAVGQGFRTNAEALRQLKIVLEDMEVTVIPVELPCYTGPDACLHLMSLISIVAPKLAVVYPTLLSVPFWQYLKKLGFHFVEVGPEEFATMGPNVLALAPGRCVMLAGNPVTQRRLEAAGCEVHTYTGTEISLKAEGGPTCLTRPILRGKV
jgi:dimethylargininase